MPDQDVQVFVIWEKVLASDWAAPNTGALARIPDPRATQFWDPERVLSHAMGEEKLGKPVWDWIGIYAKGAKWPADSGRPVYSGRPVVKVAEAARRELARR